MIIETVFLGKEAEEKALKEFASQLARSIRDYYADSNHMDEYEQAKEKPTEQ